MNTAILVFLTMQVKELERLKEVEAAVYVQTMEFLEKKRHQLQDEVDAWEERYVAALSYKHPHGRSKIIAWCHPIVS